MRLSTKSSILKNTVVELVSPRRLEVPDLSSELPIFSEKEGTVKNLDQEFLQEQDRKLKEAEIKAAQIIENAELKAQEIIQNAQKESQAKREQYLEMLREEILASSQAEGYAKGLEKANQEADKIRKQAKAYLQLAETALTDKFHKVDKELVELALKISEKVLRVSLDIEPAKLLSIIREICLIPQEKEELKIYLSSQDWEWFKDLPEKDKPPYPVVVDESLKTGAVYITSTEGVLEAGIDSQLEKIGDYLREELKSVGLDGFSEQN